VPTTVELYDLGAAHFHAGRGAEAWQALRAALAQEPGHGGALHLLGALAYRAGRAAEAAEWLRRAAEALPHDATCRSLLGAALHALGRFDEALAAHRDALRLAPDDALALNNLGTSLAAEGRADEAALAFERALAASPRDPAALCNLAAARHAQGRVGEAAGLYREALRLCPGLAEAHNNLGNLLLEQGRHAEAEGCYRRATELRPGFALAHANLARLLQHRGRPADAAAAYRRALQVSPGDGSLHAALGHALLTLHRAEEALGCCREAVRLAPADADCSNELGNALAALGRLGEAEAAYAETARLRPGWSAPIYNRGLALQRQGRLAEGRACLAEALRLAPDDRVTHSTFVGTLHYEPGATPESLLAESRRWAERHAPDTGPPPSFANAPEPERRLRVGYVSPDFRRHAVAFFLEPVLAHHDPAQVEVFCYSGVAAPDDRTAALRRLAHHWRDAAGLADDELAEAVRADGIDVLVDLAGHLEGGRLLAFARRPAPVQVGYLGYPGTTGLSAVGYRLTDAVADPPGEPPGHSEELVRLPGCFCCYSPPELLPVSPALPSEREGVVTFGALHKLEKLNGEVLDLWSRLLRELSGSRLLLARDTLHGPVAERLRGEFAARGVGRERLLLERVDAAGMWHLGLYNRIDVALDAFPWCGHTTACEALWMGVPVVTLRGGRHAGRMTASVLTCLGLTELIADAPEGYLRLAAALAADEARRGGWRAGLREAMRASALCDGAAFTRGVEKTYRELWRRWCAGELPRVPKVESRAAAETRTPHPSVCAHAAPGATCAPGRYLVGPTSGERGENWREPRRHGQCLTFSPSGAADLTLRPADTWEQVCARFPAGWAPDFVVLDLAYATVPRGLWSAPVPLVGLAADWNLLWHYYRHVAPRLDLLLTDAPGAEALRRAGWAHARAANLYGLERPFREAPEAPGGRDIDVLFVGNLHPAVQRGRLPWLGRLARLAGRWKVVVATGVFGDEYRGLLARSRVVFNRSIRGECNRWAFEAAGAGALLFQEAGNAEVPAYLRPGRECVLYGENDLGPLLEHYLSHEADRAALAEAARHRVHAFSFEALWEQEVLGEIEREWPRLLERCRARPAWGGEAALLARTWQAAGAADGGDPALCADLSAALAENSSSAALHNALGVASALAGAGGAAEPAGHFRRAVAVSPRHAPAALNLVEALAGMGERDLAAEGARRLLALVERGGGLAPEALGAPHYPPAFDHFRVEWERAAWANAGRPAAEREAKLALLRWRLHTLLAELTGELAHYRGAALARPDLPATQAALGCALAGAGRGGEALPPLRAAVEGNPFDLRAARALFQALCDSGDRPAAHRLARDRRLLSAAAPQAISPEEWFLNAPPPGDELASIIVLCCNEAQYTRLCLESVLRHTRAPYELVLVDNGSTDDTPALLEEVRSRPGPERVAVLRSEVNVGFPAGCNQGLARARGEYLVFLNNDTVVTDGWLEGLVRWALHDWPRVGMVGPLTSYSRPPQQVPVGYARLEEMPAFAERLRRENAGRALGVERLAGFCLLARREVMEKVGGFDERFGVGFFDDDALSVRALRAGYKLLVAQDVFVHHFGSRTFAGLGIDCTTQLKENFERFRAKWGESEAAGYQLPGDGPPAEGTAAPTALVPATVPGPRPKVSLCMIVRNEEDNLPACLGSAADLVDEVIVVDTGSADGTKEVAARFGARVFDFPWCDSFAAARNESLRHANGGWVFWLDADDRLDEDNRGKLRALLAGLADENVAYSMKCLCLPDASGTATVVDHVRLFRNLPGVRWEFRVHEQILPAVRRAGGQVRWADVVIRHAGYQDPALRRRKLDRDLRLLRLEDQEHPGQPFTLFNLGSVYQELGRHAEAVPLLRRSLALSHPADSIVRKLYALLAGSHRQLGQAEEALACCREGLGVCPGDPELLFVQAVLLRERGDLAGAESCLLALLCTEPGQHFASTDAGLRGYKARHNLAVLYRQGGRHEEAEEQWRVALAQRPDFLPAWLGLGEGRLRRAEWEGLEEVARRVEGLPEGAAEAAVLRGRACLARKELTAAREVFEKAAASWPQALGPRVFLSYALLQEGGDPAAAERALLAVLDLDPANAEARHNLAVLRQEQGRAARDEGPGVEPAPAPHPPALNGRKPGPPTTFGPASGQEPGRRLSPVPIPEPEARPAPVRGHRGSAGALPRVAVVTIAHNEEDLIVPFLEHYFGLGADAAFLVDNDCTDRTLPRAGRFAGVVVSGLDSHGQLDDALRAAAFQRLREGCAGRFDFVILVDTDEFLVPKGGLGLKEALARHAGQEALGTEGYDVVQGPGEAPYDPSRPLLPQRSWGVPKPGYNKPAVLRPEGPSRLSPGQHYLLGPRPYPPVCPFYLLHLVAFDEAVFLRRRLQMVARQGALNILRGYSHEYTHPTEAELRARWQALRDDPRLGPLPADAVAAPCALLTGDR
jgi:predicted O-linked N-acetylglucosamine transferase (SPINDLY family)/GT2 family glycosyltransferase